jgi:D-alanine-D-alanine ligase
MKINKHIEIVRSSIAGLSSMSQKSCDGVLAALSKHYVKVGVSVVNNLSELEAVVIKQPDLVFLGMESIPEKTPAGQIYGSKIWVTTYLSKRGIVCTGSKGEAYKLGRDKPVAKHCVLAAGLRTSKFQVIKQGNRIFDDALDLEFPLFVKPTNRGGGLGIDNNSLVNNAAELYSKINSLGRLQSDVLVEEYLPGREFSVAILENEHFEDHLVMPIELIAPVGDGGARILSGKIKSMDAEQAIEIDDKIIKSEVKQLAMEVFLALGARDYGRIDIRLDKFGVPQFLEANLIPSLIGGYGSFPKACVINMDLDYESMIMKIVRLGLARKLDGNDDNHKSKDFKEVAHPSFRTVLSPA